MNWKQEIESILSDGWQAIDTETTGLDLFHGDRPYFISTCDENGETDFRRTTVDPFTRECNFPQKDQQWFKKKITSRKWLIFHHSKFDIRALELSGTANLTTEWFRIHDTHPFSHVLRSNDPHGLKPLGVRYLNISTADEDRIHTLTVTARKHAKKLHWSIAERVEADMWMPAQLWPDEADDLQVYGVMDAMRTSLLFRLFLTNCLAHEQGQQFWENYKKEVSLIPIVYEMERTGMTLRPTVFQRTIQSLQTTATVLSHSFQRAAIATGCPSAKTLNHRSPQQLQHILYEHLKLPVLKMTSGKQPAPSTDKETLENLIGHLQLTSPNKQTKLGAAMRMLVALTELRDKEKSLAYLTEYQTAALREPSVYSLRDRLVLRSSLNPWGTGTTRFSSNSSNIQNIDLLLRIVFGPSPGCFWIDDDYDNLEMRIYAYDSGEKSLIEAFECGESVHMVICRELYPELARKNLLTKYSPEYKRTKNGNFAIIYGASADKANRTYGLPNAYGIIRKKFPSMTRYISRLTAEAESQGFVVTLFGYRLYIARDQSYAASNYRIQGTAGGILKEALRNLSTLLTNHPRPIPRMNATVHDQIVTECSNQWSPLPSNRHKGDREQGQQLVRAIAQAMSRPGELIGIPTPVSCAIVTEDWSNPVPFSLAT